MTTLMPPIQRLDDFDSWELEMITPPTDDPPTDDDGYDPFDDGDDDSGNFAVGFFFAVAASTGLTAGVALLIFVLAVVTI